MAKGRQLKKKKAKGEDQTGPKAFLMKRKG
jgi:hypothetical protein